MQIDRDGNWLETSTGTRFFLTDPRADDVRIEDIAHGLSMIPRFGGQCKRFYSVAAHSLHVLEMALRYKVVDLATERGCKIAQYCLLHDAAEAYVGDMVRPLKLSIPAFAEAEKRVFKCILARFGLSYDDCPHFMNTIDNMALATEARDLVVSRGVEWRLGVIPDSHGEVLQDWPLGFKDAFVSKFFEIGGKIVESEVAHV